MKRLVTISHCTCESDVDTHFLQNHGYCEWCAMIGDFTEEHENDCSCQHCEREWLEHCKQAKLEVERWA